VTKVSGGAARPPMPSDFPTDGDNETFHGTNPWSGPYLVLGIVIGAIVVIGGILMVAVFRLAPG
jgi:hypothetical protein